MFVDLVGSTALSARLDPEEMREVLRAYQNAVAGEVARFDGHVAKFMGDGVLAYFGWPRAHEDDAERAVRAGLAIAEAVGRLATPAGEPLAARVGIATGLVVVGDLVGEGAAQEEAVVGETPNLAARLQEAGRARRGGGRGRHAPAPGRGVRAARPRPDPAQGLRRARCAASAVVGERPRREPLRGPHGRAARRPWSGASRSWRCCSSAGGRPRPARARRCCWSARPGSASRGWSGPCSTRLAGEEHTALRYQCSPHHTGTALWPVTRQLASRGRPRRRPTTTRRSSTSSRRCCGKAAGGRRRGGAADRGAARDRRGRPLPGAGPHARSSGAPARWRRWSSSSSGSRAARPVLMVLEDAHWIDPTTLELVGLALDRIAGARVLVLLDEPARRPARPGRAPARDAAHAQPPRPRPDARRSSRAWPAAGACRPRCWARSRPGPTGCRCSSRS